MLNAVQAVAQANPYRLGLTVLQAYAQHEGLTPQAFVAQWQTKGFQPDVYVGTMTADDVKTALGLETPIPEDHLAAFKKAIADAFSRPVQDQSL